MQQLCQFNFTGKGENIIACSVHPNEREVLNPNIRKARLTFLLSHGEWAGRVLREDETDTDTVDLQPPIEQPTFTPTVVPPVTDQLPATRPVTTDLVEYATPDGQQVSISVKMFQEMLCPQASAGQARYMLHWCAHNRVDPFGGEAYFSVMDNKPVIQVSKDCWLRRGERHPQFNDYDSGILVECSLNEIKNAVVAGMGDDYLIPQPVKDRLLAEALEGKALDPKGFPARLTVRKRGQFLADAETLKGGWSVVKRKDREPRLFQIPLEGWAGPSHFWHEKTGKRSFMIWKAAVKNGFRLSFPELSGLLAQPDAPEEISRTKESGGYARPQIEAPSRARLLRELHYNGQQVPFPAGPLDHDALHALAVVLFDGKSIGELSISELSAFIAQIITAQTDEEQNYDLADIRRDATATPEAETPTADGPPGDDSAAATTEDPASVA